MSNQDRFTRSGDDAANWEFLSNGTGWERARELAVRLATRYASDPADAEDLAHDALLRALRHHGSLRSPEAFRAWIAQIVHNEAERSRRRARRTVPLDDADVSSAVLCTEAREDGMDLRRELEKLAPHERAIVDLRYEEDLTQSAIAHRLRIPEGTIKVQLHRARRKLERALTES